MLNRVYDKYLAAYTCVAGCIHDFKRNEKGVTAVEYAIVIAGVAAVVSVVFGTGGSVSDNADFCVLSGHNEGN